MFRFLHRFNRGSILKSCEDELERSLKADAQFVNSPRDLHERAILLETARSAGLADTDVVKRLDYMQRLLSGLADQIDDADCELFIAEARTLGVDNTDGVRRLVEHLRMVNLRARGPEPVTTNDDGRFIYMRCTAFHKGKPGEIELRDDGIAFSGEVALFISWMNVAHFAETTYGRDHEPALSIQEGKRRTATIFMFLRSTDRDYAYEAVSQLKAKFGGVSASS